MKYLYCFLFICSCMNGFAQNVGINTVSPQAKLHIVSTNEPTIMVDGNGISDPAIKFAYNYTAYAVLRLDQFNNLVIGTYNPATAIMVQDENTIPYITMKNGKLGIGYNNTNPATALHILSNGEAARIDGAVPYFTFYDNNNYRGYIQAWTDGLGIGSTTGNNIRFYTNGSAERLTINSAGNVGIGNNNPAHKLDISGSVNINGVVNLNSSPGVSGNMLVSNGPGVPAGWANPTSTVYNSYVYKKLQQNFFDPPQDDTWIDIPDMNHSFTLSSNTLMQILLNVKLSGIYCAFCGNSYPSGRILVDGVIQGEFSGMVPNVISVTLNYNSAIQLGAGNHTVVVQIYSNSNFPAIQVSGFNNTNMSLLFFKQ